MLVLVANSLEAIRARCFCGQVARGDPQAKRLRATGDLVTLLNRVRVLTTAQVRSYDRRSRAESTRGTLCRCACQRPRRASFSVDAGNCPRMCRRPLARPARQDATPSAPVHRGLALCCLPTPGAPVSKLLHSFLSGVSCRAPHTGVGWGHAAYCRVTRARNVLTCPLRTRGVGTGVSFP